MGGSKKGLPLLVFSSGEELVHGDGVCGECMSAEACVDQNTNIIHRPIEEEKEERRRTIIRHHHIVIITQLIINIHIHDLEW